MLQHAQNEDSNNEKRSPTAPTTWNYYNNPQTTTATVANNYFTIRLKQKKYLKQNLKRTPTSAETLLQH
jgi:hypothetical protein